MQDKWRIPFTICISVPILIAAIVGYVLCGGLVSVARAGTKNNLEMNIATKHTNISAKSSKTVHKFYRKISDYIFFGPKYDQEAMAKRVDSLFEKVQKTLGMEGDMPLLQIKLYPKADFKQLLADNGKRQSFYLYEYQTVYINIDDINAKMLIHEMCHHIVDSWFGGPPPRKMAEILATGVDRRLR